MGYKKANLTVCVCVWVCIIPPWLLLLVTKAVYFSAESLDSNAESACMGEKKGLLGLFNFNRRKAKVRGVHLSRATSPKLSARRVNSWVWPFRSLSYASRAPDSKTCSESRNRLHPERVVEVLCNSVFQTEEFAGGVDRRDGRLMQNTHTDISTSANPCPFTNTNINTRYVFRLCRCITARVFDRRYSCRSSALIRLNVGVWKTCVWALCATRGQHSHIIPWCIRHSTLRDRPQRMKGKMSEYDKLRLCLNV